MFFVGCCTCVQDVRRMLSLEGVMWLLHVGRSMLSLSGCSCFIDDNNNNTSSVAVLLIEVRGKLQVSCHFVRSHCHCHCLGSR